MTRKTCTTCKERKPIEDFLKHPQCVGGYGFCCKDCRNAAVTTRPKVKCPNCDGMYARAHIAKHMKTKKCIHGELEWKHPMKKNDRFKADGQEFVKCPCKHEQCQVKIKECTAYRHMKYGVGHKFPSELKRIEDEKKHWAMMIRNALRDDSDSERDL